MKFDEHEIDREWHVGWEDGLCTYTDDSGNLVVEKRVHRHPFGTDYAEVFEDS